ncbi:metallophosphoesterase family protein [Haloprofundus salinisoli]|uniref:metallophosphoesterase family protein n=1 Tax=Haloprofundus salinisoli TaxID=2876193 RepID=UPI001CCCA36E|nr:metallophosphoesterase [Haloprofundus salinisoli]
MLVLGDAHADDAANRRALLAAYRAAQENPDVDAGTALQLGDLHHYDLPVPTWFVVGNNEAFDVVESIRRGDASLTASRPHLLASTAVELDGLRVVGLSGTYAPTQYAKPRAELRGERRRHFVREDVARAKALGDADVLLCHQAPHGLLKIGGRDAGCDPVDEVLRALSPELCLVGHYHRHAEESLGDTRVVSLAPAWRRYYSLDPETLALTAYETLGSDA